MLGARYCISLDRENMEIIYCRPIFLLLMVASSVLSQDYSCPKGPDFSTCEVRRDSCLSDADCHVPGNRCCEAGCGKLCVKVVQSICPTDEPLKTDTGRALFCGRGPNRVDCPLGFFCNIDPSDRFAVCCPDEPATCQTMTCGQYELCYMNQVQCVTTPCPALPTCYQHPCKDKCLEDEICQLQSNCNGLCEATAICRRKPKTWSYWYRLTQNYRPSLVFAYFYQDPRDGTWYRSN